VGTSDYVVSSYVPTLASLTRSRHGWDPIPHTEIAGLLVCEASCDIDSAGYLTHAVDEVVSVRDCLLSAKARVLNAPSAHISRSQLCSLLDGTPAHILHLACHGIQELNPLKSGFFFFMSMFSLRGKPHGRIYNRQQRHNPIDSMTHTLHV
jgi:hypothetical protein